MRIVTWNINGIRSACSKGMCDRLAALSPDVLLLQEIRCDEQTACGLVEVLEGHWAWHPAQRKGYAGTAIWSRHALTEVRRGLGTTDKDPEGRVLTATVGDSGLEVTSVYLPSGSSGEHRQEAKEAWMRRFKPWASKRLKGSKVGERAVILGGDFNNAITDADVYYAKGNAKNSGFMPHERAWQERLVKSGWRDLIREAHPDPPEGKGPFTWWSNRGQARELDRGWRIDYLLANEPAATRASACVVHREASLGVSDHAPVSVDLNL